MKQVRLGSLDNVPRDRIGLLPLQCCGRNMLIGGSLSVFRKTPTNYGKLYN